jgi:hypothetical protein
MKIPFVLAAAILLAGSAHAGENLVPSGGFEEFTNPQHKIQNACTMLLDAVRMEKVTTP